MVESNNCPTPRCSELVGGWKQYLFYTTLFGGGWWLKAILVLHHVVRGWLVVESNTCPTPRCSEVVGG